MRVVEVRLSDEVACLLKDIFVWLNESYFHPCHAEDYLLELLRYMAQKIKKGANPELHEELRQVAIRTHNAIAYRNQLGSDPHPIDAD